MDAISKMKEIWSVLYPDSCDELLNQLIDELNTTKNELQQPPLDDLWYKNAVVYSLYVDLFANDFKGLIDRLDYIADLGVNCLWLLPILESPMKDAGFDISNYRRIRPGLLGLPKNATEEEEIRLFSQFLKQAHQRGIKVIFDIAMNHTSMDHYWFKESSKDPSNPYRDYYIWNKDTELYKETRLLFKGMCPSNWEKFEDEYYFHRFFEFQPDLNYRNPKVLCEMTSVLAFWLSKGVDGFRADAIPYIWKEDGTDCENLPNTHKVVQFFRAATEYLRPNTLILAEACQPPKEVVKYFGNGDECHAGYHFPLMPQIFISMATGSSIPIQEVLSPAITPEIPDTSQWFTFLRCHDELTLEMVNPQERALMNHHYRKDIQWNFREGEGISARLSNLFDFDHERIALIYSIMLSLPGTPILYYGDEFGKANDEAYFEEQVRVTGYSDTRYYVRGPVNWNWVDKKLSDSLSFESILFNKIRKMLRIRRSTDVFGQGTLDFVELNQLSANLRNSLLVYKRSYQNESYLIVHNLGKSELAFHFPDKLEIVYSQFLELIEYEIHIKENGFGWFKMINNY